jgi:sugar porter (SP) family MFS transporter
MRNDVGDRNSTKDERISSMSFGVSKNLRFGNQPFHAQCSIVDKLIAGLVCSIGGLVFGYDLGALSAVSQTLRSEFSLTPSAFGITLSASLWGTVVGSIFAGYLAIRLGRRGLVAICALGYAVASTALALFGAADWRLVLALRVLCGIAIGGFTVGCPLYLAEIAPNEWRGRFVAWFQVQVGVGVVLAFGVGYLLAGLVPAALYWRICFGLGVIPPLILLLFLGRMPEEANLFDLQDHQHGPTTAESLGGHKSSAWRSPDRKEDGRLFRRKHLRPLLLATSIALFNQLSGVNILLLYLLDVLSGAGAGFIQGHRYTLMIAGLGLVITICGTALVDKIGRKPLLISGAAGMAICLWILSATFAHQIGLLECSIVLIIYNACFAFSQGTTIWVYLSELFPYGLREKGQSYGASVHWIANAILISLFPTLQHYSPKTSLRFFGLMMLLQIVVASIWYPETKGIDLKQRL